MEKIEIKWQVCEKIEAGKAMEIVSNPWEKTHTIYLPEKQDDYREIERIHEYAHAWLAENVHHLFSTSYFAAGVPAEQIKTMLWVMRAASDWFADALLMQWEPEAEKAEIAEHVALYKHAGDDSFNSMFWLLGAGLMYAQAQQYRVHHDRPPKMIQPIIEAYRSIRPDNPNIRNLRRLINRLAVLVTNLQVELGQEDGLDVWKIK